MRERTKKAPAVSAETLAEFEAQERLPYYRSQTPVSKHFATGDRVIVTAGAGKKKKRKQLIGVFQAMQTRTRAMVFVDPVKLDDDGMRLVELRSIAPYYDDPTDRKRRARHALRMFKQGIRWFRLGGPSGVAFNAAQVDAASGTAFGRKAKRKTILQVPAYDLWPETYK